MYCFFFHAGMCTHCRFHHISYHGRPGDILRTWTETQSFHLTTLAWFVFRDWNRQSENTVKAMGTSHVDWKKKCESQCVHKCACVKWSVCVWEREKFRYCGNIYMCAVVTVCKCHSIKKYGWHNRLFTKRKNRKQGQGQYKRANGSTRERGETEIVVFNRITVDCYIMLHAALQVTHHTANCSCMEMNPRWTGSRNFIWHQMVRTETDAADCDCEHAIQSG